MPFILGNKLELALKKIGRSDIVAKCICNVELVTDDMEKALAKVRLDQSGFDTLKDELGSSRDASLRRDTSLNKYIKGSQEELDKSDRSSMYFFNIRVFFVRVYVKIANNLDQLF